MRGGASLPGLVRGGSLRCWFQVGFGRPAGIPHGQPARLHARPPLSAAQRPRCAASPPAAVRPRCRRHSPGRSARARGGPAAVALGLRAESGTGSAGKSCPRAGDPRPGGHADSGSGTSRSRAWVWARSGWRARRRPTPTPAAWPGALAATPSPIDPPNPGGVGERHHSGVGADMKTRQTDSRISRGGERRRRLLAPGAPPPRVPARAWDAAGPPRCPVGARGVAPERRIPRAGPVGGCMEGHVPAKDAQGGGVGHGHRQPAQNLRRSTTVHPPRSPRTCADVLRRARTVGGASCSGIATLRPGQIDAPPAAVPLRRRPLAPQDAACARPLAGGRA